MTLDPYMNQTFLADKSFLAHPTVAERWAAFRKHVVIKPEVDWNVNTRGVTKAEKVPAYRGAKRTKAA